MKIKSFIVILFLLSIVTHFSLQVKAEDNSEALEAVPTDIIPVSSDGSDDQSDSHDSSMCSATSSSSSSSSPSCSATSSSSAIILSPTAVVDESPHPYAVLLTWQGCKLRGESPGVYRFILREAAYYSDLFVKYVGMNPRIKFFKSKEQRDKSIIDGSKITPEEMLEMLQKGPDSSRPTEEPLIIDVESMRMAEIVALLEKYQVIRGEKQPDYPMPPD